MVKYKRLLQRQNIISKMLNDVYDKINIDHKYDSYSTLIKNGNDIKHENIGIIEKSKKMLDSKNNINNITISTVNKSKLIISNESHTSKKIYDKFVLPNELMYYITINLEIDNNYGIIRKLNKEFYDCFTNPNVRHNFIFYHTKRYNNYSEAHEDKYYIDDETFNDVNNEFGYDDESHSYVYVLNYKISRLSLNYKGGPARLYKNLIIYCLNGNVHRNPHKCQGGGPAIIKYAKKEDINGNNQINDYDQRIIIEEYYIVHGKFHRPHHYNYTNYMIDPFDIKRGTLHQKSYCKCGGPTIIKRNYNKSKKITRVIYKSYYQYGKRQSLKKLKGDCVYLMPSEKHYKNNNLIYEKWTSNDKIHNLYGPAIINYSKGCIKTLQYYINNELQRDYNIGPAFISYKIPNDHIKYRKKQILCSTINDSKVSYMGMVFPFEPRKYMTYKYCREGKQYYPMNLGPSFVNYRGATIEISYKCNSNFTRDDGPANITIHKDTKFIRLTYYKDGNRIKRFDYVYGHIIDEENKTFNHIFRNLPEHVLYGLEDYRNYQINISKKEYFNRKGELHRTHLFIDDKLVRGGPSYVTYKNPKINKNNSNEIDEQAFHINDEITKVIYSNIKAKNTKGGIIIDPNDQIMINQFMDYIYHGKKIKYIILTSKINQELRICAKNYEDLPGDLDIPIKLNFRERYTPDEIIYYKCEKSSDVVSQNEFSKNEDFKIIQKEIYYYIHSDNIIHKSQLNNYHEYLRYDENYYMLPNEIWFYENGEIEKYVFYIKQNNKFEINTYDKNNSIINIMNIKSPKFI